MENEILSILPLSKQGKKKMFEIKFLSNGIEHVMVITKRALKKDFLLSTEDVEDIVQESLRNFEEESNEEDYEDEEE